MRDTVNFLDYVGEPTQAARRALGVWVVLFLLVFTWLAWLMKRNTGRTCTERLAARRRCAGALSQKRSQERQVVEQTIHHDAVLRPE